MVVSGAHLNTDYGFTKTEIEQDGFPISFEIDYLKGINAPITDSLGRLQKEIGDFIRSKNPDIIVVLGDRMEIVPVCLAAVISNVPIAHISGGEITEGAIDNQIRNAVSKLAHLHFPSLNDYRKNLILMGEEPWRITVTGEPGLDEVNELSLYDKNSFYKETGLKEGMPFLIVTFHPQTIDQKISVKFLKELFERLLSESKFQFLVTASNFDEGGHEINAFFGSLNSERIVFIKSLGQIRYYSSLKYASAMLGNSSSGIVESQSFELPVVNVGNRQQGRLTNTNVINCKVEVNDVMKGLLVAVSDEFKLKIMNQPNIYGKGEASQTILNVMKEKLYSVPDLIYKRHITSE